MTSIRFSKTAHADIAEIALYLCDLNPISAERFVNALDHICVLLAEHPRLGRPRRELADGLRSFPVGNYLVFYVIEAEAVHVIRVLHGARNLPGIFKS